MGKSLFEDIVTEESQREAHDRLYYPYNDRTNLNQRVNEMSPEMEHLMRAAAKALFTIKGTANKRELEFIKQEYDKIALLLDKFVEEFKPMYEEIFSLYMAEKLAGTFDNPASIPFHVNSATASSITVDKILPAISSAVGSSSVKASKGVYTFSGNDSLTAKF